MYFVGIHCNCMTVFFFVTGIGAYIVCFVSKLVCGCGCGCCIWICSGDISFQIVFAVSDTKPIFHGEKHEVGLQIQSVTLFPILCYSAICSVTVPKQQKLSTAHIVLFIIPSYIFLKTQIRIKLVKLTMQWPKSSRSRSSFSHLAFSQSSEGKRVSYSSYGKICNLCLPVYERVSG